MSFSSISSVTLAVDKATSKLLLAPDWTMNIRICDFLNIHRWRTRDAIKALKKRLMHKDATVQILALTLMETMVKNCGEHVHLQIAEKHLLQEMVLIVKKKGISQADPQVRTKIVVLLDSWHEAFGGARGKYPQYYWAYEELGRSGIQFPRCSKDAPPKITPGVAGTCLKQSASSLGVSTGTCKRLDETMATEIESLSLSSLESMRNVMDLLSDMIHATNQDNKLVTKDEVLIELVDQCRSNQKMLIQMLTTTRDEKVLACALELNDDMQAVLGRYDALASGTPLKSQASYLKPSGDTCQKSSEAKDFSPEFNSGAITVPDAIGSETGGKEQNKGDFVQLSKRCHEVQTDPSEANLSELKGNPEFIDNNNTPYARLVPEPMKGKELALCHPPEPVTTTSEELDLIDLLSITLSAALVKPSNSDDDNMQLIDVSPNAPQNDPEDTEQALVNSYVVPWAQPQFPKQSQMEPYTQAEPWGQSVLEDVTRVHPAQLYPNTTEPTQLQFQYSGLTSQMPVQPQFSQFPYGYYPPPWAAAPSSISTMNINNFNSPWNQSYSSSSSHLPVQAEKQLQRPDLFPSNGSNEGSAMNARNAASIGGHKPFVPSYRLFEDLNVYWKADGCAKMANNTSFCVPAGPGESMIGGRK